MGRRGWEGAGVGSPCLHPPLMASVAGRDKLWGQMDIWSDQGCLLPYDKQSHTVGAAVPKPPHEGHSVAAAWQMCSAQPLSPQCGH